MSVISEESAFDLHRPYPADRAGRGGERGAGSGAETGTPKLPMTIAGIAFLVVVGVPALAALVVYVGVMAAVAEMRKPRRGVT